MIILGIIGLISGIALSLIMSKYSGVQIIRQAQKEAKDLIQIARNKKELFLDKTRSQMEENLLGLKKTSLSKTEEKVTSNRKLQTEIDRKTHKEQLYIESMSNKIEEKKEKLKVMKNEVSTDLKLIERDSLLAKEKHQKYIEQLKDMFSIDSSRMTEEYKTKMIQESQKQGQLLAEKMQEDGEKDLEKNLNMIMDRVLSRFQRAFCAERGISPIPFQNVDSLKKVVGKDNTYLELVEKSCGVDIIISDTQKALSVQGIDPVRREWGRRVLVKLSKKRSINKGIIESVIRQSKHELFTQIDRDGNQICNNLKMRDVSKEIRKMMGSLRYRYSFAQNQYFHCEEVSWLCGLLMSEFNENFDNGKRAGLLHDIGKAMDHVQSGGHDVIGADFIQKYGEKEDIVYAVRAHHHNVPPSNTLDFLVIAADAISGARPGARRSTVEAYHQKVQTLEKIGRSFKGVNNVFIMNAGREVRILVNSKSVSDVQSLSLSKKIAQKIEEECSYPGWIKVTVVRQVEVSQSMQETVAAISK